MITFQFVFTSYSLLYQTGPALGNMAIRRGLEEIIKTEKMEAKEIKMKRESSSLPLPSGLRPLSGEMLVFLGAVFWSLNAPLVKFIQMDPLLLTGSRSLIAGISLLPFLRIRKLNLSPWLGVYLLSYCGLCTSLIYALSLTAAPIAIGMQYTSMIWLFLADFLRTHRLPRRELIPVLIILGGVCLFMASGFQGGSLKGFLISATEGVFFALMSVSSKKACGSNPLGLTSLANLFTAAALFLLLPPSPADMLLFTSTEWIILLILGVVQIGIGYSLYNMGLRRTTAQKASVLALWEMILGPVWVALFLGEYPSPLVAAGFVIILAGMYANSKAPQS